MSFAEVFTKVGNQAFKDYGMPGLLYLVNKVFNHTNIISYITGTIIALDP